MIKSADGDIVHKFVKGLFAENADVVFVIGGRDSSNTSKLAQVCGALCEKTFWIQTKDDIQLDKISGAKNIS
ncbi:MAG: hypothetical protein J6J07_07965, partial [Oscillospiraceae bacterium]|nr:hypothetical protein [Oscillospiraceae bacterium]